MVATKSLMGAAVLLATTTPVIAAAGSAIIHNQCPFEVYLWSISENDSEMTTLTANGGEYTEAYQINPDGGGISIKMGPNTDRKNITQFEYTLTGDGLWYDLSNIDGYPFADYGVNVVPSDSSCKSVSCPAGTTLCAAAYNVPSDNFATSECSSDTDTVVILCSGETDTSGSSELSSIASQAASTASVVTVFSTVSAQTTSEAQPTTTVDAQPTTTAEAQSTTEAKFTHHSYSHPTHKTVVVQQEVATTTAAPVQATEAAANPYVVIQTTFVTHVVTVEARSAQPTAAAEVKRDTHHEHAAVHQEHPVRRHQHARAFPKK